MIKPTLLSQRLLLLIARTVQRHTEKIIIRLEATQALAVNNTLTNKLQGGPPEHWLSVVRQYAPEFLQDTEYPKISAVSKNECNTTKFEKINTIDQPQTQVPAQFSESRSIEPINSNMTSNTISINKVESTPMQTPKLHGYNLAPDLDLDLNLDLKNKINSTKSPFKIKIKSGKKNQQSIFSAPNNAVVSTTVAPQFSHEPNHDSKQNSDKANRKNNLQRLYKKLKNTSNIPLFAVNKMKPSTDKKLAQAEGIKNQASKKTTTTKSVTDKKSNIDFKTAATINHLKLFNVPNNEQSSTLNKQPLFNTYNEKQRKQQKKSSDKSKTTPQTSNAEHFSKQEPFSPTRPLAKSTTNTVINQPQYWPSLEEETCTTDRWPQLPEHNNSNNNTHYSNSNIIDSNRIARRAKEHQGNLWSE